MARPAIISQLIECLRAEEIPRALTLASDYVSSFHNALLDAMLPGDWRGSPPAESREDALTWLAGALVARAAGASTAALEFVDAALAVRPDDGLTHFIRALVLIAQYSANHIAPAWRPFYRQRQLGFDAAVELDQAQACGFVQAQVFVAQAELHLLRRDHAAAAESARLALEYEPQNVAAWRLRTESLVYCGQAATACDAAAAAPEQVMSDREMQRLYAWSAAHSGRYEVAERVLSAAVEDDAGDEAAPGMRTLLREVTRSRHAFYRALFRKDLWMERLHPLVHGAGFVLLALVMLVAVGVASAAVGRGIALIEAALSGTLHPDRVRDLGWVGLASWPVLGGLGAGFAFHVFFFWRSADFLTPGGPDKRPATLLPYYILAGLALTIASAILLAIGQL